VANRVKVKILALTAALPMLHAMSQFCRPHIRAIPWHCVDRSRGGQGSIELTRTNPFDYIVKFGDLTKPYSNGST
jgi:hypothetical protein